jgi:hypothetical protein
MNTEIINSRIEELRVMKGLKSSPPVTPVSVIIQEAKDLYKLCLNDREELEKAALDWKFVEELPLRAEILSSIESDMSAKINSEEDCQKEWKIKLPLARELKEEMVHYLKLAFYTNPPEKARLKRIASGASNDQLILQLTELAELGDKYPEDLKKHGMDPGMRDKARQLSEELYRLHAKVNTVNLKKSDGFELRNKAYYHLKETLDEVRRRGRLAFWKDKGRQKGYISEYIKRRNQNFRQKKD